MMGVIRFRNRALGLLAAAALVVLVGLGIVFASRDRAPELVTSDWVGTIQIEAPSRTTAGAGFAASARADAPNGTPAMIVVFDVVDTHVQSGTVTDGVLEFDIAAEHVEHAGLNDLLVAIGNSQASVRFAVEALDPVDPVVPLVGPRTIIANGDDFTMVVASPMDRFGNPVANGTAVLTEALRPGGSIDSEISPVVGGVAATIVESGTEVGRVSITSSAGEATGPANVVDQVAGVPDAFVIEIDERNPLADGFTLHAITTSRLTDTFGNVLPDGVSATFVIDSPSGRSFVESTVQGGVAAGLLEAPSLPGPVSIVARVSGRESEMTTAMFAPAVVALPVLSTVDGDEVTISVGRVLATRGGYPADGTTVELVDPATGTVVMTRALREGLTTFSIALDNAAPELEIHVLGFARSFEVGYG